MSSTMEVGSAEHVYFVVTLKTNNIDGAPGLILTATISINGAAAVAAQGTITDVGNGNYAYLPHSTEVAAKAKCLLYIPGTSTENPVTRVFSVVVAVAKEATLIAGVELSNQGKLDVNAEVDNALNTSIPVSPIADSINQRIKAVDDLTQATGVGDLSALLILAEGATGFGAIAAQLATMKTEIEGTTFDTITDSLEAIRDRGDAAWVTGAGGSNIVLGAIQTVSNPGNRISSPVKLEMFDNEIKLLPLTVLDAVGAPIDLSAIVLKFVVFDSNDPPNGAIEIVAPSLIISGANNEIVIVTIDAALLTATTEYKWILWDSGVSSELLNGTLEVRPALLTVT